MTGGTWLGEQVALRVAAAGAAQLGELLGVLDALGDDADAELPRRRRDGDQDSRGRGGRRAVERADERAVELDHVDRQLAEMAQRGVAGAEVVEGDAHAERAQVGQARRRADRVGEHGGLGDLEAERASAGTPVSASSAATIRPTLSSVSWRGEMFTDTPISLPCARQSRQLAQRRAEDPGADRHDQPVLLRERDELVGGDQAPLAVRPAQQRLARGHRAVGERDDRLVVDLELVALERVRRSRSMLRRRSTSTRRSASKIAKRLRPIAFARYIAMSASWIRRSAVFSASLAIASPTLAETTSGSAADLERLG
jgi:hypothetical protein